MDKQHFELSVVMPCLNESETLATCIKKAQQFMKKNNVSGEVVIADNGSTDGSIEIAKKHGARVVHVKEKGYGSALQGGIQAAKGQYIIMGDSDDSYDFSSLEDFVEKLRDGHDLVMGNRFKGGIEKGAMPFLHRYLGNPVLSFIGKLFFKIKVGDFHCGLRGFSKEAYNRMNLNTSGMEFASEMVVKASLKEMDIAEVPTILSPDGRSGAPHLNTWRDGWRHLRFLMVYSPKWLYLIPGIAMMALGLIFSFLIFFSSPNSGAINFNIQSILYTSLMIIIGFQFVVFYALSLIYTTSRGILPQRNNLDFITNNFNLEKGLILGSTFIFGGIVLLGMALMNWKSVNFGYIAPIEALRISIPSFTLLILGLQTILYSFFWHILSVPTPTND